MTDASTKPRVLLLHGLLSRRVVWDRVRAELAADAVTLAPDLLGYGPAMRPNGSYRVDDVLDHLDPIVERFRPTHVVGNSMGAIVALGLRARHSERLQGVGLVALPAFDDGVSGRAFLRGRGPVVSGFLRNHHVAHVGCRVAHRTRPLWLRAALWRMPLQTDETIAALFQHCSMAHHGALDEIVFSGCVPELSACEGPPVAAIHGTADQSAPYDAASSLASGLAWRFEAVEGANHQLVVERSATVAEWIRREVVGHIAE
jgi:pimeloyl-ACP methyl ester carboxylesterase